MNAERQYLNVMQRILDEGEWRQCRNGRRRVIWGVQMRWGFKRGFPLLTTKRVWFKGVKTELAWFLRGDTNVAYLHKHGVHIWDKWADENGDLGPIYGAQWRNWHGEVDQIANVLWSLVRDPYSTRHIVTAWDPASLSAGALPACHMMFQLDVSAEGCLNMMVTQRSADWFLGVPFNIASYSLLLLYFGRVAGYDPGAVVYNFGNVHLYENQIAAAKLQLTREPYRLPQIRIVGRGPLEALDAEIYGYEHHPAIKVDVVA